jgi:hypothetical protein
MYLSLSGLQSHLELVLDGLEVSDVASSYDSRVSERNGCMKVEALTTLEQGNLARLLVRRRKSLLEAGIAVSELITPSLLGLDALLTDGLAAAIGGLSDMP